MGAISTLQELVAPLSEQEFLTLQTERRLLLLRSTGENRFESVLNWSAIQSLLETGGVPTKRVQMTRGLAQVPPMFLLDAGKPSPAKISRLLDQGASLVLRRLEDYVPEIAALKDSLGRRTLDRIHAAVVVTTGQGGALKLHYDVGDLIVFQIEGSKRWRIYGPPVVNPVPDMIRVAPPRDTVVLDDVLRPGDQLIMPSGYWHECDNGPDRSVHVAVIFMPLSAQQVMAAVARQMASEEVFRQPLIRHAGRHDSGRTEELVKASLIARISRLSLSEILGHYQQPDEGGEDY